MFTTVLTAAVNFKPRPWRWSGRRLKSGMAFDRW
jgi:hypothetical protein